MIPSGINACSLELGPGLVVPGGFDKAPGEVEFSDLTIGIEEEYQIIDPETRELKSYITQILEDSKLILREQVKAELHQSMVEVGTELAKNLMEDSRTTGRWYLGVTMGRPTGHLTLGIGNLVAGGRTPP